MSSDEEDHSSSSSSSDEEAHIPRTADEFKNLGNKFYLDGEIKRAVLCYTRAIEMSPGEATYWGNRAQAYMMQSKWRLALNDANKAIQLKPGFVKAHLRASKCHLQFGDFKTARELLQPVIRNPTSKIDMKTIDEAEALLGETQQLVNDSKFDEAQPLIMRGMKICQDCIALRKLLVEVLIARKSFNQARLICESLYASNNTDSDILRLRGTVLYYTGSIKLAIKHFQQILKYDPDNRKTAILYKKVRRLERAKQAGNSLFSAGRNREAIEKYTAALAIDPSNDSYNAKLYGNRAISKMKLRQFREAKVDCDHALRCDRDYTKIYQRRATCHSQLEQWTEAIRDLEMAKKLDPNNKSIAQELRQAKVDQKMAQRPNHYKTLGVPKRAQDQEIKKAYRKLAMKWHPDRHRQKAKAEQDRCEAQWKKILEAYEVLSDPQQRQRYDSGADIMERGGMGGGFHSQADLFRAMGGMRGMRGGMGGMPGGFRFSF